jgi:hypothetical protein
MRYNIDFPDNVKSVAEKYIEIYYQNSDTRMNHKYNMKMLSDLGKEVAVFKQIADCIETIMWYQDQVEEI